MTNERLLNDVVSHEERWAETLTGIIQDQWSFKEQVEYFGIRIADAVVLGRTSLERVSRQLSDASGLWQEAILASDGNIASLREEDSAEALARELAYSCLRNGKNQVKDERRRRLHLAGYQARVSLLNSMANTGLGRLEARDLGLDNLWYDKEES